MVADPARSRMLSLLLSGDWATAGELAAVASVTPATASAHLAKLLNADFVLCEPRGRHRYYRLADADVAYALEALALVAERGEHATEWSRPDRQALRDGRCCYGHLAGRLGVALYAALVAHGSLQSATGGYTLTDRGSAWFNRLGIQPAPPSRRRRFAYACMDWSERRDHLAGQLADQALEHFLAHKWLRRREGRVVEVTAAGRRQLLPHLALPPPVGAERWVDPADTRSDVRARSPRGATGAA